MNRPGGVVATVVLLVTGGLMCLAMAGLMAFSFLLIRQGGPPSQVELPYWILIFPVVLFGGLATWVLITAVGVWKLRPWGRISLLIFSGVLVFMQGSGLLIILFVLTQEQLAADQRMLWIIRGGFGLFYGIQAAIGIWWLAYFNRAEVKQAFAGDAPVSDRPGRPLSITIIAWHWVFGALCCFGMLAMGWPAAFFGVMWTGAPAMLAYVVMGSLVGYLGFALLKLHPKAVDWSIGYLCFMALQTAAFWLIRDPEQTMRDMMEAMPWRSLAQDQPIPATPFWPSIALAALSFAVPLWYLVTRKAAYIAAAQAATSSPVTPPAQ